MVQGFKGSKLVNCPPQRKGPYQKYPIGKYQGIPVEEIIRKDPRYFMWTVKEWLNVSPSQAFLFEEVTEGGEIPRKYISEENPPVGGRMSPHSWDSQDEHLYWTNQDLIPNYDFDPRGAPSWWLEYKEKIKGEVHPGRRLTIYQKYVMEDFRRIKDSLK